MFNNYEIVQMPLTVKRNRAMVESFLAQSQLRLDVVDYYAAVVDKESYEMLAGGGFQNDIIKCIAVSETLRGTGMSQQLISHLISEMNSRGTTSIKVFTKPGNADIFKSLGFKTIGENSKALFLENSLEGLTSYTKYLASLKREGKNGMIVMNANPFTLGHRYLVEQAAAQVDNLYVIVVDEDKSLFTSSERFEMVRLGCEHVKNAIVCHGSSYIISAATFPSYFIKKMDDVALAQIELDLDVTARHIAPALGVSIRFVGSEPTDQLTHNYNEVMKRMLPVHGINVVELTRFKQDEIPVSASEVRRLLKAHNFKTASNLVPCTTLPYLIAWLACDSLKQELELTPKPGLVDKHDNGSHIDMDYSTMLLSINALRPYFVKLAIIGSKKQMPQASIIQKLGIEAEQKMLNSTNGVNTHRGALFSMGLAIVAASYTLFNYNGEHFINSWRETIIAISKQMPGGTTTHGANIKKSHNVKGALDIAQGGYQQLIETWLPFYSSNQSDDNVKHKTLLLIMSQIDDTNVIHRAGIEMALKVKNNALHLLEDFSIEGLEQMNQCFIKSNISPGGAADMLSLTIFMNSFIQQEIN